MRRDLRLRRRFVSVESDWKILVSFQKDARFDPIFRCFLTFRLNFLRCYRTRFKNYCSFSGRNRSVFRQFGSSRLMFLENARRSKYAGFKKAIW
jgi:ribosomal protein S14